MDLGPKLSNLFFGEFYDTALSRVRLLPAAAEVHCCIFLTTSKQASDNGKIPQLLKTPAKVNLSVRTLTQAYYSFLHKNGLGAEAE